MTSELGAGTAGSGAAVHPGGGAAVLVVGGAAVLVVGGANMDLKAQSAAAMVPATSNPGSTSLSPGGVGRNVAENAARLGADVTLVSIVGVDALGEDLLRATAGAGVDTALIQRTTVAGTGTYTALLDATGDLVAAVADMAAIDQLDPAPVVELIARSAPETLVVADGNLSPETLSAVLVAAESAGLRVVLDPVSVPKAIRLSPVLGPPLFLLTPNRDELAALTGLAVGSAVDAADSASTGGVAGGADPADVADAADLIKAAEALRARGVEWVWIRMGAEGSMMVGPEGPVLLPPYAAEVVDVTGAGDAMLGAFCRALMGGATVVEAARFGQAAAVVTIASPHTVRPDLSISMIEEVIHAAH